MSISSETASRTRKLACVLAIDIIMALVVIKALIVAGSENVGAITPAIQWFALASAILALAYTSETLLREPLRIVADALGARLGALLGK